MQNILHLRCVESCVPSSETETMTNADDGCRLAAGVEMMKMIEEVSSVCQPRTSRSMNWVSGCLADYWILV
jgi:hypothetical protein